MVVGGLKAVVFDLLYTLVHPGEFPGGGDRATWLAGLLMIEEQELKSKWNSKEWLLRWRLRLRFHDPWQGTAMVGGRR